MISLYNLDRLGFLWGMIWGWRRSCQSEQNDWAWSISCHFRGRIM